MANNIANDYEVLAAKLIYIAMKLQKEYNDEITAGKLYSVAERYEKHAWLLKSLNMN